MTAEYWVAKYVEDPFRDERRNVGVFVRMGGTFAARLYGERDDGVFDGRIYRSMFTYPDVYAQWRDYWRESLDEGFIETILKSSTTNFYVVAGGHVSDTGGDNVEQVCSFLFSLLVSNGKTPEAYQWETDTITDAALASDITETFANRFILADLPNFEVPHPVAKDAAIKGKKVVHSPSFSQRNGRLYVIEHIDLGSVRQKNVRERAGFMAYMFDDIVEQEHDAVSYSVIRPERDGLGVFSYAREVLGKSSQIVNWSDEGQRERFIRERERIALSVG